jgi:hypothetical protein
MPNIDATRRRAPAATFHIRAPIREAVAPGPGPSAYAIPRDLGGPSSSFHIRPTHDIHPAATPGPGAYSPVAKPFGSAPKFSLRGRAVPKSSAQPNPPYYAIPSTVGAGPRIAFGASASQRQAEKIPGPSYLPPPLGTDAKKISLRSTREAPRHSGEALPGPGAYHVPTRFGNEARKFSFYQRTETKVYESSSPGPAAYLPDISAVKPKIPAAAIHIRPAARKPEATAGYYDLGSTLAKKKMTIGRRETLNLVVP